MKKLLLAFLLIPILSSAQNEYFQNNPAWIVNRAFSVPYPCIQTDSTNYFLNGDSVINSFQYKKLFKRGHIIYSWQSPNPNPGCIGNYTYQDTMPTGYLRSQGQQMYYIPHGDTNEYLLYDFNLIVGSTIPLTYTNYTSGLTVTAIDSFFTPYGYLKRFYINNSTTDMWIEGVGSNYGLVEPFGPQLDQVYQLICYSENDTAYWPMMGPVCDVITTTPGEPSDFVMGSVYPNPATSTLTIEVPMNGSLIIVNEIGQTIFTCAFGYRKILSIAEFSCGMYAIHITDGEKLFTTRVVVE